MNVSVKVVINTPFFVDALEQTSWKDSLSTIYDEIRQGR